MSRSPWNAGRTMDLTMQHVRLEDVRLGTADPDAKLYVYHTRTHDEFRQEVSNIVDLCFTVPDMRRNHEMFLLFPKVSIDKNANLGVMGDLENIVPEDNSDASTVERGSFSDEDA